MVGVGGDQWVVTTVTLLPGDADGQPTAVVGSHSATDAGGHSKVHAGHDDGGAGCSRER